MQKMANCLLVDLKAVLLLQQNGQLCAECEFFVITRLLPAQ